MFLSIERPRNSTKRLMPITNLLINHRGSGAAETGTGPHIGDARDARSSLNPCCATNGQPQQFYLKIKHTRRENTRSQQTQQICISLTFDSVLEIGSVNSTVTQTCFFLEAMDRTMARLPDKGQWENKHCGARRGTVEDGHSVSTQ